MSAYIAEIEKVDPLPKADRLDIYSFDEHALLSSKINGTIPRYKIGDLVVFCPVGSIIPEYLLRQGFWIPDRPSVENPVTIPDGQPDLRPGHGVLGGVNGDEVCPFTIRTFVSKGIMFPVYHQYDDPEEHDGLIYNEDKTSMLVVKGTLVSDFLGIKHINPTSD